ncbi:MAG: ribonuclease P protein component [Burkholderiales bacterium]
MNKNRLTFPSQARLRGGAKFGGKFPWRRQGRLIVVLARKDPAGGRGRLGLVVGKRNVRLATDRAKMKRAMREAYRHIRGELEAVDIVVRMRQAAGRKDLPEVRGELQQILGQVLL